MWSLGVLLYEMMTFTYPFVGRGSGDLAQRVCLGRYNPPAGQYSNDLTSIVRRLLQVNPALRPSAQDLLNLQCVKLRMPLLEPFLSGNNELKEELLSTIKVPTNMRHVNLPNPTYGKKVDIVKPLEQRMHVKKGAKKDLPWISSPDLQMIADLELWSPNHEDGPLVEQIEQEINKPLRAPRASVSDNPRFRHRVQ
jgi:NIMA (never in mitosis gene a)-related kinase